jgi:uncharacterized protein (DUF2141 family)
MLTLLMPYFLFVAALVSPGNEPASYGDLTVFISNVKAPKGEVAIALYKSQQTFLVKKQQAYLKRGVISSTGTVRMQFDDLPHGEYAIAIYHDVNNNKELDKNMMGIPSEPYGFSNNIVPTFRVPTFDEARFSFQETTSSLTIRLQSWRL